MKSHAEVKATCSTPLAARANALPVADSLKHHEALRKALRRAGVQPRVEVGAADEPLEREAEEAAQQVMRMPEPRGEEAHGAQAKAGAGETDVVSGASTPRLSALNTGGAPLDSAARAFFEPRFGTDFGRVRLHTGDAAAQMAAALHAKAFTLGNDIAFGATHGPTEKPLLAHELAHVVQQNGVQQNGVQQRHLNVTAPQGRRVQRQEEPDISEWQRIPILETLEAFEDWAKAAGVQYSGTPRSYGRGEAPEEISEPCPYELCWVIDEFQQVNPGEGGPREEAEEIPSLSMGEAFEEAGDEGDGWKELIPVLVARRSSTSRSEGAGWEELIPVWGPAREAFYNFKEGNTGWGLFHTAMALSEVFILKAAVVAGGKLVVKGVGKVLAKKGAGASAGTAAKRGAGITKPANNAGKEGMSSGKKAGGSEGAIKTLKSADDIAKNPQLLYGKSKEEVAKILGPGWKESVYGTQGHGWKFLSGDKSIFYHPGGGRHVGSYYGYSSAITGKTKVVGPHYKPLPGDKARIIHVIPP